MVWQKSIRSISQIRGEEKTLHNGPTSTNFRLDVTPTAPSTSHFQFLESLTMVVLLQSMIFTILFLPSRSSEPPLPWNSTLYSNHFKPSLSHFPSISSKINNLQPSIYQLTNTKGIDSSRIERRNYSSFSALSKSPSFTAMPSTHPFLSRSKTVITT